MDEIRYPKKGGVKIPPPVVEVVEEEKPNESEGGK